MSAGQLAAGQEAAERYTPEHIAKMYACARLLPEGGCEALREALSVIVFQREGLAALAGVAAAIRETHSEAYVNETDWNPDAHVPVTLTIADARRIYAALRVAPPPAGEAGTPT